MELEAEDFLNSKDIFDHPRIEDTNNKNSYDVAELLEEFAKLKLTKQNSYKKLNDFIEYCSDNFGLEIPDRIVHSFLQLKEDIKPTLEEFTKLITEEIKKSDGKLI